MDPAGPARVERRLAAILAADVAGYSRLMGADEEGTLAALKAIRRELGDPKIVEHRGRIVKTTGDGLLVEFQSVVDAVRCAVEVQRAMAERNAGVPTEKRIEFRFGIHQGDIIVEDGDIFGDGVNLAARLEGLAEPGGICVSGRVRADAAGKVDVAFDDLGEQSLKNIARPLRVYRVRLGEVPATDTPAAALALPDKPSIAVLPFQNMSGDPEQEYFADGMVEEIITALSRIRWLFVIARNSTFTYKGRAVDVKQVGRELGVRYVLEGSVRKGGNRVRITAQLIDATNGAHLWADRFDGSLEDVFELQDKVAISVAGVIEPTLRQSEIERARRKRPDSLDAYDLYLRALPDALAAMPEDADKALALLGKAIDLEPDFAAAHAIIAFCHEQRYLRGGMQEETRNAALHHARQAIAAGGDDAAALATAGFVIAVCGRDYEAALAAFDRSFALSSSLAFALGFSSIVRAWKGDDAIAVEHAQRAIRLSPFDPQRNLPYVGLAYAHFAAGRFEETVAAASLATQSNPRFTVPIILHAAALGSLDRSEDAKTVVQRLLELQPGLTVATAILSARYVDRKNIAALENALRRAGLPEG
ncbi:MAG TPA: adenylate/guanylate cyclase domain-containing protein [Stellaceae bacterium]|jgi:adenylate cyclase|nr:adenylate/guanylate cyclase domain-containing protein [Stellaceae bacterium]